jgi:ubiquinol oxidase
LEKIGETNFHYTPKTLSDKVAFRTMKMLEKLMEAFFREKYNHHAVTLETVAAVPGIVASAFRHLRSLRTMKRDHQWIPFLQEEAENERMHLLIWMQHTKPTKIERAFVVFAQSSYVLAYGAAYALSPRTAHRMVGYLEEAAFDAYTHFLGAIDKGDIKNVPAMPIAKNYYRLPDDATLRDVVLMVRADEAMHRDFNHQLADQIQDGLVDHHPITMEEDLANYEKAK